MSAAPRGWPDPPSPDDVCRCGHKRREHVPNFGCCAHLGATSFHCTCTVYSTRIALEEDDGGA